MLVQKIFKNFSTSKQASFHHWLLLSFSFSFVMLFVRMIAVDSPGFIFLIWNLFLAYIPYLLTEWASRNIKWIEIRAVRWLLFIVWLLFIPNTFYIITDLFHLENAGTAPRWYDLLLIFSFAWNGILCGIASIRKLELIVQVFKGPRFSLLFIFIVMWLNALGIYIGRFMRYNSWDVLSSPFSLLKDMSELVLHPMQNIQVWGMTGCYAVFMTILYFSILKMGESFVGLKTVV